MLQSLWGRVVLGKGTELGCVWVEVRGHSGDLESGDTLEHLSHSGFTDKMHHCFLPSAYAVEDSDQSGQDRGGMQGRGR